MNRRSNLEAPLRRVSWRCALFGLLLLGSACEQPTSSAGPPSDSPTAEQLQTIASLIFEVDPASGLATLKGVRSAGEQGPSFALHPVGGDHVRATASCAGCGDSDLENQTITVNFVVNDFVLWGVDFARTASGDALAAMTCRNCRVLDANLQANRGRRGPNAAFSAVLRVEALQPRPFTVHFSLLASVVTPAIPPTAALTLVDIHPAGASSSRAIAINNRAEVLVLSNRGSFLWSATGGHRALPSGNWRALNGQGYLVGSEGGQVVMLSAGGDMQVLPLLPGHSGGVANDLNDSGVVVGSAYDPTYPRWDGSPGTRVPIIWEGGVPRILSAQYGDPGDVIYFRSLEAVAVNDRSDVVGGGLLEEREFGMHWAGGGLPDLLNGRFEAEDINDAGQALFTSTNPVAPRGVHPGIWTWTGEEPTHTRVTIPDYGTGNAINNHGVVVGGLYDFYEPYGPVLPYRWSAATGTELLPLPAGSAGGSVNDVNDAGQIVGTVSGRAVLWTTE